MIGLHEKEASVLQNIFLTFIDAAATHNLTSAELGGMSGGSSNGFKDVGLQGCHEAESLSG